VSTPACRYHCRCCRSCFTSLEAFDAHRPRHLARGGCEWPDDAALVEVEDGVCRIADPDRPKTAVTLYRTERAAGARVYFEAVEGRESAPVERKPALLREAA
jgi:hypothetical protein